MLQPMLHNRSHCNEKPPLSATRDEPALCCDEDPAQRKLKKKKFFFKGNRISVPEILLVAAQHRGRPRPQDIQERLEGSGPVPPCWFLPSSVSPPPQGSGRVSGLLGSGPVSFGVLHLAFLWPKPSSSGCQDTHPRRQRSQWSTSAG